MTNHPGLAVETFPAETRAVTGKMAHWPHYLECQSWISESRRRLSQACTKDDGDLAQRKAKDTWKGRELGFRPRSVVSSLCDPGLVTPLLRASVVPSVA